MREREERGRKRKRREETRRAWRGLWIQQQLVGLRRMGIVEPATSSESAEKRAQELRGRGLVRAPPSMMTEYAPCSENLVSPSRT